LIEKLTGAEKSLDLAKAALFERFGISLEDIYSPSKKVDVEYSKTQFLNLS
jgi:hypothetical protein